MVQFEVALFHCLIVFVYPISDGRTLFQVISLEALELYFSLEFDENPFKLTEIMDDQSSERATAASTNEKPVKRRGRPPGTKNNPNRHLPSKLRNPRNGKNPTGGLPNNPGTVQFRFPPFPYVYDNSQYQTCVNPQAVPYLNFMSLLQSLPCVYHSTPRTAHCGHGSGNVGDGLVLNNLPFQGFPMMATSSHYPQTSSSTTGYPPFNQYGMDDRSTGPVVHEVLLENGSSPNESSSQDNVQKAATLFKYIQDQLSLHPEKYQQINALIISLEHSKNEKREVSNDKRKSTWASIQNILQGSEHAELLAVLEDAFNPGGPSDDADAVVEAVASPTYAKDTKDTELEIIEEIENSSSQGYSHFEPITDEHDARAHSPSGSDPKLNVLPGTSRQTAFALNDTQPQIGCSSLVVSVSRQLDRLISRASSCLPLKLIVKQILSSGEASVKPTMENDKQNETKIYEKFVDLIKGAYNGVEWQKDLCDKLDPILRATRVRSFIMDQFGLKVMKESKRTKDTKPSSQEGSTSPDSKETKYLSYTKFTGELPKCSGRTALDQEVLNDEYVISPSVQKVIGKRSKINVRPYQTEVYDYYDEIRHEIDIIVYRNLATVRALEELATEIDAMSAEDRDDFQLDCHPIVTSAIHRLSFKILYCDDYETVLEAVRRFPARILPVVLQRFKIHQRELAEFCSKCNALLTEMCSNDIGNVNKSKQYVMYHYGF